jgi:cell division protein FtsI/penicillin-binding protein 2
VGVPAGFIVLKQRRESADKAAQKTAAQHFANAWKGGALETLSYADGTGADVAKSVQTITSSLTSAKKDAPVDVVAGAVTGEGDTRTVPLKVSWNLAGDRKWSYDSKLTLVKKGDRWLPKFAPTVIHPRLIQKAVLKAATSQPARGEIIGANDEKIVTNRPAVLIGMEPGKADDIDSSAQQIGSAVGVDAAAFAKRAKAASSTAFVQAILLRKPAYDEVKSNLDGISGLVVQEHDSSLGPTADFARALIGRVGDATAEIVKESEGRVSAGDQTGLSGLQRTYDKQLAGTPGLSVTMVELNADGTVAAKETPQILFSAKAVNGTSIHITLDAKMQDAADKALIPAPSPAAMVVIKVSTGEILAAANGGGTPNANGYNRAFLGQYAPGSTFKVVTSLGLLQNGVTASTNVPCPPTINAGGKKFKNFEDETFGDAPFIKDFALSCNTAFISLANKISTADLAKAGKSLGYGASYKIGVPAFTGQVPNSGDAVSHAAAMIGQGKVLASPLSVAAAAAAVASGSWHAPTLVVDPDADAAKSVKLPAAADTELKKLMRQVVLTGTGSGLRAAPGGPVSGKTGTAEYGDDNPPKTHAWFTGFQGDLAFAVVVEDGETGADTAVPLLKTFLNKIR